VSDRPQVTADSLDIEPADGEVSDAAIDALAVLLIDADQENTS
jgi:hypothetical protein